MKYICLHIFLLVVFTSFSQVGIGTKNPDEALHIAGIDATIRLEGLSSVNNVSNDGADLIPTLVDTDGTVLLNPLGAGSPHNYITDASTVFASTVTVVANLGISSTTTNIYNYNITLTTRSFLEIKYGLAFLINETTGVKIFEGKSRQIKKVNIEIRLKEEISETDLKEIALSLKEDRKNFKMLWIFYYLPGQKTGNGTYTTRVKL